MGLKFNPFTGALDQVAVVNQGDFNDLFIDANGNVGIGTTSPGAPLHAKGNNIVQYVEATGTAAEICFRNNTSTGDNIRIGGSGNNLTFDTGSGESARIDSDGRLLVGTNSAIADNTQALLQISHASGPLVVLGRNDTTVTNGNLIGDVKWFSNAGSVNEEVARIRVEADADQGSGDKPGRLTFSTTADGASSPTTRMTIKNDGNVGIGTQTPGSSLEIARASGELLRINTTTTTGGYMSFRTNNANIGFLGAADQLSGGSSSDLNIRSESNLSFCSNGANERLRITSTGELQFKGAGTNGSPGTPAVSFNGSAPSNSLVIDSTGKLGLGTSSPSSLLHVKATGAATALIEGGGTSGDTILQIKGNANDYQFRVANSASQYGIGLYDVTNAAYRYFVNAAGNVGIGTTSPTDNLEVSSSSGSARSSLTSTTANTTLLLRSSDSGKNQIFFGDASNNFQGKIVHDNADNSLTFGAQGSNDAFRIDSAGRLLVGTSTARSNFDGNTATPLFQIEGVTAATSSASIVRDANDLIGSTFNLGKTRATAVNENTVVSSGDQIGIINFQAADGTNLIDAASIQAAVDGTPGANDMPGRLVFSTTADGSSSSTERMRIDSGGSVTIFGQANQLVLNRSGHSNWNFSNNSSGLALHQDLQDGNGPKLRLIISQEASPAFGIRFYNTSEVETLRVEEDGDVLNTNNSYGSLSDAKLKENIVDASSQWSDLKALQVRKYNFKAETSYGTHTQIGLIAQEVELVSPGLVSESPDLDEEGNDLGTVTKSVNYSVLYMKAVKALQEAMERIEQLEAKVAALEAQ